MSPPELARDAPVLNVLEPMAVGCGPVFRMKTDLAGVDGLERDLRDGPPRETCVCGLAFGGRNEPLIGEHRLDDDAGAPRSGDIELVRLLRHQATDGREVDKHLCPCLESIKAAVGLGRAVHDTSVEGQDTDRW